MNVKTFGPVEIKDADQGLVAAVFSTFNVLDHDGDVVLPGAFTDGAQVRISAYGHGSWLGELPVGKGVIRTTDNEAILEGEMFLDTAHGRDTFTTIKRLGPLGEWSYSLEEVTAEQGEWNGRPARIIKSVVVHEVSPVLKAASINTRTLLTKQGLKLAEHIDAVLAEIEALVTRAQGVVALRAEKGKRISEASQAQLKQLAERLKALERLLMADDGDGEELAEELEREYLRFLAHVN